MNGIFDSHAHYDDERFDADRDELLERIHREGVEYIMTIGADLPTSRAACMLAERYDFVYFAAGIHPEQAGDAPEDWLAELKELAAHPKCRAVGEIGLDYYWAENPPKERQQELFRQQVLLAKELGLDKISTYGLLKDRTRSDIHAMIDHLEAEGYLRTEQEHQSVFLTPAAGEVLYRGKTVSMLVEQTHEPETPVTETAKLTADDAQLFDALKELRLELAKKAEIPAFVVFSNATLADMAKKKPATMSEFKKVSGVGEIKAAWYGTAFLKCIQSYLDENA